jgi:hypothetical protein
VCGVFSLTNDDVVDGDGVVERDERHMEVKKKEEKSKSVCMGEKEEER